MATGTSMGDRCQRRESFTDMAKLPVPETAHGGLRFIACGGAATPVLVGPSQLAAAVVPNSMSNQQGSLGGPALAGFLIAGPGLAACYLTVFLRMAAGKQPRYALAASC
jgi:hypothetical protein